jgi:hypothetical protein
MINQLRHLDIADWVYGLLSAAIGGGAGAVSAAVAAALIKPGDFGFAGWDSIKLMATVFVVNGLLNMFFYLKQSPLPAIVETSTTTTTASVTTTTENPKP